MDKTIRVMGTLRKNQNKMLEIKQHYNRKGKCLYMRIGRLDTAKVTISKLVHMSTETSKSIKKNKRKRKHSIYRL